MTASMLVVGFFLLAQAPQRTEVDSKEILQPYYQAKANEYEFYRDAAGKEPLTLVAKPILTWTNVDNYLGNVFVWTYAGRPEVIGCIGSRQTPAGDCFVFSELHALGLKPLPHTPFGDGERIWRPLRPGVRLDDVAEAPAPAATERQRLRQMRDLAREFNGSMKDGADVTQLRLLPQPIYRYQSGAEGVLDGALFALVWKGTDPEIVLLLEAREIKAGLRWQYAIARFNYRELSVSHNDREVWSVEASGMNSTEPYISGRVEQTTLSAIRESRTR